MFGKSLAWMFYPAYVAITTTALFVVGFYASRSIQSFHLSRTAENLEACARLLAREVARELESGRPGAVDRVCKERGREIGARITVILPSGIVAGDSEGDPAAMENHSSRFEVAEALAGRVGSTTRRSSTLSLGFLYVAVPLEEDGRILAAVRTSLPLDEVERLLDSFYAHLALVGIGTAVLAAAAGVLVFRRISGPLRELKRGAERFATGDLGAKIPFPEPVELPDLVVKIPLPQPVELRDLARAMNSMAEQLDQRLKTIVGQRNEREAILMSMEEGVLAVDPDERILSVNAAAARMLGLAGDSIRGKAIQETVRSAELQRFAGEALAASQPVEGTVVLADGGAERFLQARGTMLRDASGARAGAVIVLNDVSRIKKLEQLRKEFVADVSHELKTPITSIQGYVETLMDGAMNDREEAGRFLAIVARHADRLNTIIEDLLLLSRLDQAPEAAKLEKDESSVAAVLATAVEACAMKSREKGISVLTDCPADLTALVNAQLLAQAVTNLLDNAVKYSESGASVTVSALREGGDFVVSVRDRGCGIPAELLPRIGERFFRVDKARSRGQGGTGLGLAIVKHIAEAHGGSLAVSSQVGKGSTFSIRLPLGSGPRDRRACPGRPEGGSGA